MVLPVLRLAGAAVTGLWAVTELRRPGAPPTRDCTFALRVTGREVVAHDENVLALTLMAADGTLMAADATDLPPWHPGAHLDIQLPSGRVRQYSLCGDPERRDTYRIAVRRIPGGGGGSVEVHDALPVGSVVTTSGPRNAFPLAVTGHGSPTERLRFIAGGIGITPILPMLGTAERNGVDWSMIYVGRSIDTIPFTEEVSRFGDRVEIRTDDIGGVPTADELLGECSSGTAVYACGPADMITALRQRMAGCDDVELHFERFAAAPVVDGEPFTVTAGPGGPQIAVAADETLLDALQRAGIQTPYSCRQGFCGTCRAHVLAGEIDHRDTLLTAPERDAGIMLPCVSRAPAGGHLTLEF